MAHISTIINVDAIFTINIDAQCGCATANKFDADQLKAKRFNRRSEHLCQFFALMWTNPPPRHKKRAYSPVILKSDNKKPR
ncbi:hypothetical protein [Klebsiella pneumoniae IS43]|uniref:Uncharacterized protein n=1 Tax=Klebsiella pneumoniae IS43 TaxID=1432552 RepID=W1DQZ7_KLEPN|nr:hypothetical protein [Klebsiella pneumoniae IS43]